MRRSIQHQIQAASERRVGTGVLSFQYRRDVCLLMTISLQAKRRPMTCVCQSRLEVDSQTANEHVLAAVFVCSEQLFEERRDQKRCENEVASEAAA